MFICPLLKFVPLQWPIIMSFDHSLNYTEYILTKSVYLIEMINQIHTGLDLGVHLFKLKINGSIICRGFNHIIE